MIAARLCLVALAAAILVVARFRARDLRALEEARRARTAASVVAEAPPAKPAADATPAVAPAGDEPAAPAPGPAAFVFNVGRGNPLEILGSLSRMPPEEGAAALIGSWADIKSPQDRLELLQKLVAARPLNPRILDILNLGMSDADLAVRVGANALVKLFAFEDFEGNPDGYDSWRGRFKDLPLDEVLRIGAAEFVARAPLTRFQTWGEFSDFYQLINSETPGFEALQAAGLNSVVYNWMTDPMVDETQLSYAVKLLGCLKPDEAALRKYAFPLLDRPSCTWGILNALSGPDRVWAADTVLPLLRSNDPQIVYVAVSTVSSWEDKRFVPALMEAVLSAKTQEELDQMTWTCLQSLVDVRHQKNHDLAWWREWWKENEARFRNPGVEPREDGE